MCLRAGIGFFLACVVGCPSAIAGQPLPRSVLVIDQFEVGSAFSAATFSSFRTFLGSNSERPISVYTESLDRGRFRGARIDSALQSYLRERYSETPIGAIVANGSATLDVVLRMRRELWPEKPVIFSTVDESALIEFNLPNNVTGATVNLDLGQAVSLAHLLVPNLKRIAVVGDPPERQFVRAHVRAQMDELGAKFELLDLTRLTMLELKQRTASLPDDAMILYLGLTVDAQETAYTSRDAVAMLSGVANRPLIVQAETHIGYGALGGYVADPEAIGRETATMALRVLAGTSPSDIPVTDGKFMKFVFDSRQLQRWNIRDQALPPGSDVRFRQPSKLQEYRSEFLGAVILLLFEAALIVWLLHEHHQRHNAEVLARSTMAELARVNRVATAGELSASIAHEVNQPLTGITMKANAALRWLAAETPDLGKARASLEQIVDAAHRASNVVSSVRALFRKNTESVESVDINDLIAAVLAIVRLDLTKHGIIATSDLNERISAITGDSVQIQQVILNLVMNAIEAMQSSGSKPRLLRIRSDLNAEGFVHVSVRDSGPGIDPADLDRVFKPLFTTKDRGMGMGLSICRSIIEAHNGRIWATSTPGCGSVFEFVLPTKHVRESHA
jgi:signal transduction histidine kinase